MRFINQYLLIPRFARKMPEPTDIKYADTHLRSYPGFLL